MEKITKIIIDHYAGLSRAQTTLEKIESPLVRKMDRWLNHRRSEGERNNAKTADFVREPYAYIPDSRNPSKRTK